MCQNTENLMVNEKQGMKMNVHLKTKHDINLNNAQ